MITHPPEGQPTAPSSALLLWVALFPALRRVDQLSLVRPDEAEADAAPAAGALQGAAE